MKAIIIVPGPSRGNDWYCSLLVCGGIPKKHLMQSLRCGTCVKNPLQVSYLCHALADAQSPLPPSHDQGKKGIVSGNLVIVPYSPNIPVDQYLQTNKGAVDWVRGHNVM